MDNIRRKIQDSFIYHFIVRIINLCSFSYIMKPSSIQAVDYEDDYSGAFIIRLLGAFDELLETFYGKIRSFWMNNRIIKRFQGLAENITSYSLVGRVIGRFNFAYLVALYIFMDAFARENIPTIASIWDELMFISIIAWLVVRRILYNKKYMASSIDVGLVFFALVYMVLVFLNSPQMNVAIEGYRAVVQHMLWFFPMVQLLDSKKVVYRTIWFLIGGIGLIGIHGIYQFITKAPMLGNWVDSAETITTRVYSITKSPNALGSLLVLFIPIAFSMIIAHKDIICKIIASFFTITMGLSLIFTFSRGAWLAAFIAIMIFLIFINKRLIMPVVTILLIGVLNINSLWNRIRYLFTPEYMAKSSDGGRLYRYATSIEKWSESKLLGLGIGRFGGAVAMNHNLTPYYMDNYYLKTLTESGIIGLGAFVMLIISTIYKLYRYILGVAVKEDRILMYGLFSGLCGVLIQNFVENIFELPFMVIYFWISAAIIVAMFKVNNKNRMS